MNMNRKFMRGAFGGMLSSAVNIGVSFVQFRILLLHMPLEATGIWMIFANLGSYAMFLDMGLTPTLGREVSFAAGSSELCEVERAKRISTLVRSCTIIVGILATTILLSGGFGGWSYLHTIVPNSLVKVVKPAWFVYILGVAINLVGQGWFAAIYGLGLVFEEKIIRSVSAILGLVFLSIAIFSYTGFMGLAIAYLLQCLCSVLMARYVLLKMTPYPLSKERFDLKLIRNLVGPSVKYAATLLGGILILQTDNIVIASTLGPQLVPNYQAVAKVITILMSFSMILVMTSTPLASQAYARKDIGVVMQLLSRNQRFALGVIVVLGSFFACFSDRIISVWLGPGHFVGFPIVWVLLIVMLLEAHHQTMAAITMSTGRIVFLVPALIAGVLNIAFSVTLAKFYGLIGVACGTMIAQIMTNNWYAPWYTMKLFNIGFAHHARTILFPTISLIVVMLTTGTGIRFLTSHLPLFFSSAIGAVSTAVFGTISFSFIMVTRKERTLLYRKLRDLGTRWTSMPSLDIPL